MGCQVQSELWLTNLLGKRVRKGKGRATSLAPANRAGISVVALASVVASPGFWGLPFRGTSAPLTCGTFGVAGPSQAGRLLEVKEGERGWGASSSPARLTRFPSLASAERAGVRQPRAWFIVRSCVPHGHTGRSFRQGLRPGGPLGSRRWVAFPVCYLGKVCILASQSPRRTWYMTSRLEAWRREPDMSTPYGGFIQSSVFALMLSQIKRMGEAPSPNCWQGTPEVSTHNGSPLPVDHLQAAWMAAAA